MADDPFTLVVAPDSAGDAAGVLFQDSGDGYAYRSGEYSYAQYEYTGKTLTATMLHAGKSYAAANLIERIEVLGWRGAPPNAVRLSRPVEESRDLEFRVSAETGRLVIRKPGVLMASEWQITIS